jgi:hypothetical protein
MNGVGAGGLHLGKLGRGSTRDLGHAQLLELSLELIQLADKVIAGLVPQFVCLNLDLRGACGALHRCPAS